MMNENNTEVCALKCQEFALNALIVMTLSNGVIGTLMLLGLPMYVGFSLATISMYTICFITKRSLMGDERLWESPNQYKKRIEEQIISERK